MNERNWRLASRRVKGLGMGLGMGLLLLASGVWVATGSGRSLGGSLTGERLARAQKSPHFEGGKFVNLIPTPLSAKGRDLEMITRFFTVKSERTPVATMPIVPKQRQDFTEPPAAGLEVSWLGHATTLLEVEGVRVMTDPMLSDKASPISWLGPSRYHQVPLKIEELPRVDVAVVSHDHYDHLDMATVEALARAGTTFVVPLGIGAHLEAWGVPEAQRIELDWWESTTVKGLTIHCVPARHYSGRGLFDQNEALWSGWVFKGQQKAVYYSGDTGWGEHFAEIGSRLGPFELGLIKIGEYDVTWPDIHIDPEEAVRAAVASQSQLMLPVHWGTFNLAYHAWDEPIRRAVAAAKSASVSITTPRPGEKVVPGAEVPTAPWWEAVHP